ncbi:uncharacterized protein Dyak_GE27292, isoform A [Drosophila yakuba]|uniref:Uncharacterized protein, isoform A n=1 Tax=Drosophila yakuba TaxID=7245 RepID=A0A0R1DP32_DROYA|nr:uncharacterized protein Dyak_GE27292, isoform A [Drosophila yakuba]
MNHIMQKCILTMEEESRHINLTKRCGGNCNERKLEKLSSPIVPGVSCISRKRSIPWEENTPENFSAKRARKQIPNRKLKITQLFQASVVFLGSDRFPGMRTHLRIFQQNEHESRSQKGC